MNHRSMGTFAGCCLVAVAACGTDQPREPATPVATKSGSVAAASTFAESASAPAASAPADRGTAVPQVTGLRVGEGETLLRSAGFLSINVIDASGQGRTVLEKNNWVIVSQSPPAGSASTGGVPVTLEVSKPTDALPTINSSKGVVPDIVCRDLQTAQDALRSAGFYLLVPKDGLGRSRIPLVDRNWIVVEQSAAPGNRPSAETKIELVVVKYGEPTGSSGCRS